MTRIFVDNVGRPLENRKDSAASSKVNISDFTIWILTNHCFDFWANKRRNKIALSADENAWTDMDRTVYVAQAPVASLEALLELEADRFASLSLTAEGVQREAGAVLGEFRKGQASPDRRLHALLWETAFEVATYGHPTIGLEADIRAMPSGIDRAIAFHRTFYRPERSTIVVAGDVSPDVVVEAVGRTHGGWTGHPDAAPAPVHPEEPPQDAPRDATERGLHDLFMTWLCSQGRGGCPLS